MDGYEATRIVLSRIQNLEPENASKIMGLLLIQDHGEKEMIRLAFGPETLLHSVVLKAKKELGLVPTRLLGSSGVNLPYLSIPTNPSTFSWKSDELMSPSLPFHGNGVATSVLDVDEVQLHQDHDLFYPQTADACDSMGFPSYWGSSSFKKSNSVSDIIGADDPCSEFWWRHCLYYARGYCKNGNNCRFIHGAEGDNIIGSPNKIEMMEQCHELLRSKSARQQRLSVASQLMGSPTFPYSPKCMSLANDSQRAAAAALVMGDEYDMNKFNRYRLGFSIKGEASMVNPASRQIYLTFPSDSTFREEDVSNYFSMYGPVQDVRIPYQQKRMFGFVTFLCAETVKIILAKGNPHFVCDARVLVKPYKEKGKIPDKHRKQTQVERGEFSPCGTPTGLDSRDPFDLQLGARMFYNNQDILWRRKLEEQNDLQQALELQNRRMMGLKLLDVTKNQHQRGLSSGSPIPSPSQLPSLYGQSLVLPRFQSSREAPQENCSSPMPAISVTAPEKQTACTTTAVGKESASTEENGCDKESPLCEDSDFPESLEHNLPDSSFASPAKASGGNSAFSNAVAEKDGSVSPSSVNHNWIS